MNLTIKDYFEKPKKIGINNVKSSYMACLIHARSETGRNTTTGKITNKNKTGSWSGALLYLVLIDHIGCFFSVKKSKKQGANNFENALFDFTKLSEKSIRTLYALRCCFAHKFSLYNIGQSHNPNRKKDLTRIFTVTRGTTKLIVQPKKQWDGLLKGISNDKKTKVDLEKLGNLVENIHKKLVKFEFESKLLCKDVGKVTSINFITHK